MSEQYRVELFQVASQVPEERRPRILLDINRLIAIDWEVRRDNWTAGHHPFHEDHGLVLLHEDTRFAGELIYRRLDAKSLRVIYVAGTDVDPAVRDKGSFRRMLDTALKAEFGGDPPVTQFYLCFRTRSPFVYCFGRALCEPMVPTLETPEPVLEATAREVSQRLFGPGVTLEPGTLRMRGVYQHMHYRREPRSRTATEVNAWFAQTVPDPADAVFCFGLCRNRWSLR